MEGPIAFMTGQGELSDWFVDSGASRHMTGNESFFAELKSTIGVSVLLANGEKAEAKGIGSGCIVGIDSVGAPVDIQLNDVLFVPNLTSGLISVSALARKKFSVDFSANQCEIKNKAGIVVVVADRCGSLYRLCTPDRMLCDEGKGMKLNSKKSRVTNKVEKAQKRLDVVHISLSDLMVNTPSGNKHYLTFVDEFTGMTFVYFLQKKSDVCFKMMDFIDFCKTKCGEMPKVILQDGGKEFMDTDLQRVLNNEGISVSFSPPHSAVAQKKSRYLKKITECMLIDSRLDRKYWGEAISTATYIQNRSTSKFKSISSFERWFGQKPNIGNFRRFGSKALVRISATMQEKALIFVRYSNQNQAYRFLDLKSGSIFVSRSVKFMEGAGIKRGHPPDECLQESIVILEPLIPDEERLMRQEELSQQRVRVKQVADESVHPEDYLEYQADDTLSVESCEEVLYSDDQVQTGTEKAIEPQPDSSRPGRSTRGVLPARYKDYVVSPFPKKQQKPAVLHDDIKACSVDEIWPSTAQSN